MFSRIRSASVVGVTGYPVLVEVDLTPGIPTFTVVGLPDAAIREAKERVLAALKNSGFSTPLKRITVNLSPAHIRKEGPTFDLPMAIGILGALNSFSSSLERVAMIGELSLDGVLRPVRGVLPMVQALKENGMESVIVPAENGKEAALVAGIKVIPAKLLKDVVSFLNGELVIQRVEVKREKLFQDPSPGPDLIDVRGQWQAKRALEIVAAGRHNLLMVGPPGSGKTMLARRLSGLLPPMSFDEAIETTKIHSVAGTLPPKRPLVTRRPFRAPHHTISDAGLVGGGAFPRPGEVSLAHNGVLFLDELPEFHRNVLEVLRQPLEEGYVTLSRARMQVSYPARFLLIAAMNPCPCGFRGDSTHQCTCSLWEIKRYMAKISGPLLDRIDLHVEVPSVSYSELWGKKQGESSEQVRARVLMARELQRERFGDDPEIKTNADMGAKEIEKYCALDEASQSLLKSAMEKFGLSARAFHRVLKVARTIADLEGSSGIRPQHTAEALQYRILDRDAWLSEFGV